MSTFGGGSVVDSKVVEFSLENGKFEENAAKSLSTIEKLKQALKFDNGAEGLSEINSELKNINFDTLNTGVETAKTSFSALEAVALGVEGAVAGVIGAHEDAVVLRIEGGFEHGDLGIGGLCLAVGPEVAIDGDAGTTELGVIDTDGGGSLTN